jgi:hypothetical protein
MAARPQRMVSRETAPKLWLGVEQALREQGFVVVHQNVLFIHGVYEEILRAHGDAHRTRQPGCPTCTAQAEIGGKDNSDA